MLIISSTLGLAGPYGPPMNRLSFSRTSSYSINYKKGSCCFNLIGITGVPYHSDNMGELVFLKTRVNYNLPSDIFERIHAIEIVSTHQYCSHFWICTFYFF